VGGREGRKKKKRGEGGGGGGVDNSMEEEEMEEEKEEKFTTIPATASSVEGGTRGKEPLSTGLVVIILDHTRQTSSVARHGQDDTVSV